MDDADKNKRRVRESFVLHIKQYGLGRKESAFKKKKESGTDIAHREGLSSHSTHGSDTFRLSPSLDTVYQEVSQEAYRFIINGSNAHNRGLEQHISFQLMQYQPRPPGPACRLFLIRTLSKSKYYSHAATSRRNLIQQTNQ